MSPCRTCAGCRSMAGPTAGGHAAAPGLRMVAGHRPIWRVCRQLPCRPGRQADEGVANNHQNDQGLALVLVLLLTSVGGVLAGLLVLLSAGESVIAARNRSSQQARAAADAGLERTLAELRSLGDWNLVLGGVTESSLADLGGRPRGPTGSLLDLEAATAAVQRESDLRALPGADRPRWRLFAYGPLTRVVPAAGLDTGLYLVSWVADDEGDGDGAPGADSNGIVQIWSEAYGPGGTRRAVRAGVARVDPAPGPLRRVWWRRGP